jgi:hypothetical protein
MTIFTLIMYWLSIAANITALIVNVITVKKCRRQFIKLRDTFYRNEMQRINSLKEELKKNEN